MGIEIWLLVVDCFIFDNLTLYFQLKTIDS